MIITRGENSYFQQCSSLDSGKTYELTVCGETFPLTVSEECEGCILFEIRIECTFLNVGYLETILLQDSVDILNQKMWIQ